jgi:hypothetical protein
MDVRNDEIDDPCGVCCWREKKEDQEDGDGAMEKGHGDKSKGTGGTDEETRHQVNEDTVASTIAPQVRTFVFGRDVIMSVILVVPSSLLCLFGFRYRIKRHKL